MKLLDRYMSAVSYYLPTNRRDEIVRELRSNILDKLEGRAENFSNGISEKDVSAVLTEMGHPQKVAASFLPPQRLVSEDLFPLYKHTLNYALILAFISGVIKTSIIFVSSGDVNIVPLLYGFANTALIMFAVVTGLFYVFSNPPGGKPLFNLNHCWSPEQLPPVILPWQRISACEQASEFSLSVFLILILHHTILMSNATLQSLSFSFAPGVISLIPWISIILVLSLLLNVWNIRFNFWTVKKLYVDAAISFACATSLIYISRLPEIIVITSISETSTRLAPVITYTFTWSFLVAGLWLLYECGRGIYRAGLLTKAERADQGI